MYFALLLGCGGDDPHPWVDDSGVADDTAPDCPAPPDLVAAFGAAIEGEADACDRAALAEWVAAKKEEHGPWNQDVRRATSSDGDTFEAIDDVNVLATAGVPEAVIGDDGRTYLFHVVGDIDRIEALAEAGDPWMATHGVPGLGALGLAVSDDGVTFEEVEEFEVEGLTAGMVVDPDVTRAPDGTWRLWYVAMTMQEYLERYTWEEGEEHDVWVAESTDLVRWVQRPEPVVHGPYADPSVWCFDEANCAMSSFGLDWSESTDGGETFTYAGTWETPGFAPEFTELSDGAVRLYYNSKDRGAPLRSYRHEPGGAWEPEDGVRMETYGEAVTIVPAPEGGWNLYYHTFKDADDIPI
ncbi:MAG: hypothetical protein ACOZNI_15290 [Myxococcota bacterium]